MKILIIRFSEASEILLSTALIRCLKQQLSNAEIHFLCEANNSFVLEQNKNIDKLIGRKGDLRDLVFDLLPEKYDYIIDLQNNYNSYYIRSMLRQAYNAHIKVLPIRSYSFRKLLLQLSHINLFPSNSVVQNYFNAVRKLKISNDGKGLDFEIQEENKIKREDIPMSHIAGYCCLDIQSGKKKDEISIAQCKELVSKIPFPIILIGKNNESEKGEEIKKIDPIRIYNSCGKFNQEEIADLIRKCNLYIGTNTFETHLAARFSNPILLLYYNENPSLGKFPYFGFNDLKHQQASELKCIGNKKPFFSYFQRQDGMQKIKIDIVIQEAKKYLKIN